MYLISFIISLVFLTACQSKMIELIKSKFKSDDELEFFDAQNNKYFPKYIVDFFPSSDSFVRTNPGILQASQGVKLIEVKPLTQGTAQENEANLSWSADGAYLGFEVTTSKHRRIMLKDLTGNFSRELRLLPKVRHTFLNGMVVPSAHSYNAGLSWSHVSRQFVFMSNGNSGSYNLYLGGITEKESPLSKSLTKDGYATWNPREPEIAFVSGRSGSGDIYVLGLNSQNPKRLSYSNEVDIFPDWAESGKAVVYSSGDAFFHNLKIVKKTDDGGWQKPTMLTNWSRDDLRPKVSPNGRYVAFYANQDVGDELEERKWNIHVVKLVPGKTYREHELKNSVVARDVVIDLNTGPAWTPDSRRIFYVRKNPGKFNPIYSYDLETGLDQLLPTNTKMNRDLLMSSLGVLSFRAQVGVWDRVYLALTNQGRQIQGVSKGMHRIRYLADSEKKRSMEVQSVF